MDTLLIVAIVVAVLVVIAIAVSAARKKSRERGFAQVQHEAQHDDVDHHRERAGEAPTEAAVAEERAQRAKVEAELDEERAARREQSLDESAEARRRVPPGGRCEATIASTVRGVLGDEARADASDLAERGVRAGATAAIASRVGCGRPCRRACRRRPRRRHSFSASKSGRPRVRAPAAERRPSWRDRRRRTAIVSGSGSQPSRVADVAAAASGAPAVRSLKWSRSCGAGSGPSR